MRAADAQALDVHRQRVSELRRLAERVLKLCSLEVAVPDEASSASAGSRRRSRRRVAGRSRRPSRLRTRSRPRRTERRAWRGAPAPAALRETERDVRRATAAPEGQHRYSGWSCQRGALARRAAVPAPPVRQERNSQTAIASGIRKMNAGSRRRSAERDTASAIADSPSASSLWRRMRRSRPSYSSAGICCVFHERPHARTSSARRRAPASLAALARDRDRRPGHLGPIVRRGRELDRAPCIETRPCKVLAFARAPSLTTDSCTTGEVGWLR